MIKAVKAGEWTAADWRRELDQFDDLMFRASANNRLRPAVKLPFGANEVVEEVPPVSAVPRMVRPDPDHRHSQLAAALSDAIDGLDDLARRGHLDRSAGLEKRVLHVDDDERRLGRIQIPEDPQVAPDPEQPLLDEVRNSHVVMSHQQTPRRSQFTAES